MKTIRAIKAFAAFRKSREKVQSPEAFADQAGTVRLKCSVFCDRDLTGHRLIPKTVLTA